jgi:hypothetical protein
MTRITDTVIEEITVRDKKADVVIIVMLLKKLIVMR